jgi:cytoskeletal protein CcmA (bactofilin family)
MVAMMLALPFAAGAAIIESGETYMLTGGDIIRSNLYASGGVVQLNGSVEGDALVAGGNITISDTISEDLAAAGGTILVLGNVGEDARLAGGNVTVTGRVGAELLVVAGMVTIGPSAVIQGDANVMGGQLVLDGTFEGDVEVQGEDVSIGGHINGNLSGVVNSLTIADNAVITGNVVYESNKELTIAENAVIQGEVIRKKPKIGPHTPIPGKDLKDLKRAFAGILVAVGVFKWLAMIAAALLLVLWFNRRSKAVVEGTLKEFGNNLLTGFVGAIVAPIVMILLLFTGIGAVVTVLGGMVYGLLMMLAGIYAGVVIGAYVRKTWTKSKKVAVDWKSVLLGVTLVQLAVLVPVLGCIFQAIIVLSVFGLLGKMVYAYLTPKPRR